MSQRESFDVIVVGAGIVGASCALALAKHKFKVALVEERTPPEWRCNDSMDLRVVALAASSVALFERLGVWRGISQSRVCGYRRMRVWDSLAPGELGFDAADEGKAALGWIAENRLLQHALWQALLLEQNVRLCCPSKFISTDATDAQRTLTLEGGAYLKARLVIAADGRASPLRERLGIGVRTTDYRQRAVVAHVSTERSHDSCAWQRFLPGATVAFLPLDDGRSSIVWSLPDEEAQRVLSLSDAAFCRELGAAFDFRLGNITQTTARAAFPLRMQLAERYIASRFALIGDAAHAVHPLAGQGLNLGLRDVAALVEVLVAARERGTDIAASHVLRRYERMQRSENELSARGFDAIQKVFGSDRMPVATLRAGGLALVDRIAPLKRLFSTLAAG